MELLHTSKISPASRISQIQEYYFSRKLQEVNARKAAGHDVISLAIGSPDLPPSEILANSFLAWSTKVMVAF